MAKTFIVDVSCAFLLTPASSFLKPTFENGLKASTLSINHPEDSVCVSGPS